MKSYAVSIHEEVQENEKLWNEEKGNADPQGTDGLKSVGASIPGGDFEGGAEPEFDETDAEAEGGDSPISGAEGDLVADEDE